MSKKKLLRWPDASVNCDPVNSELALMISKRRARRASWAPAWEARFGCGIFSLRFLLAPVLAWNGARMVSGSGKGCIAKGAGISKGRRRKAVDKRRQRGLKRPALVSLKNSSSFCQKGGIIAPGTRIPGIPVL